MAKRTLYEVLVEDSHILQSDLDHALEYQNLAEDEDIGDILEEMNLLSKEEFEKIVEQVENQAEEVAVENEEIHKIEEEELDLDGIIIPAALKSLVPVNLAEKYIAVPYKVEDEKLYIAIEDRTNFLVVEDIETATHMRVVLVEADRASIERKLKKMYGDDSTEDVVAELNKEFGVEELEKDITDSESEINNAPTVRFVNAILERAVNEGASDIHIEPLEDIVRVRMRVDGKLLVALTAGIAIHSAIIARIKIIGNLNIAERRLPQDGRTETMVAGRKVDIRISTLPTVNGEKAVLRLLDRSSFLKPKEYLGFTPENILKFDSLLKNPNGIILVTGPTGSGKSTTLYTMLNELNQTSDNIITVEDPVEYMMRGINQVHVNPLAGLDFAAGLRSILRQDPDIIMVGEIRDNETVSIAIKAAITGHLVLSTIHTNSAASTISRLIDMEVDPYLISAALVGVISQRLVRKLCNNCKRKYKPSIDELSLLGLSSDNDEEFYTADGCSVCNNTGYKGRIAVHEILVINREIREMIAENETTDKIEDTARKSGMKSLNDECMRLLRAGVTSVQEVVRISYSQL